MIIPVLIVLNLISFAVAGIDKLASKKHRRRVPERHFILFSLLLGGAGVLFGFHIFRHKTRHSSLLVKVWLLSFLSYGIALGVYMILEVFL